MQQQILCLKSFSHETVNNDEKGVVPDILKLSLKRTNKQKNN